MAIIRLVDGVIVLAESHITVTVDVVGAGTVSGAGEYTDTATVTLSATPSSSNVFLKWTIDGEENTSNPVTFSPSSENVEVIAYFYTTIESYLSGCVSFPVTEAMLNTVRIRRGISYQADVLSLSTQTLELATADIYMFAASAPSSYTGAKDSDGGWSHSEANYSMSAYEKGSYKSQAQAIYKKYGDSAYKANVSITALNGTPYYGCR